jgi:phosphoribosylformylglycinamidine synthase
MSVDGNGRYCYLDPKKGAMLAVAEAARNVACAGAKPLAATNCLNFGNPERPAIMWQFGQAVAGIGEACRALDTPITGGNVSLYNETDGKAIQPTPIIGVVGVLEHADRLLTRRFQASGDVIVQFGRNRGELGGSEYLARIHGRIAGAPPSLDLAAERALQDLLVGLAADRLVRSAHDCSDGGLAVALAECCFGTGGVGAEISVEAADAPAALRAHATIFGESASRVLVSVAPNLVTEVLQRAAQHAVPAAVIGEIGGNRLGWLWPGRR